jgi:hypothetical protein
MGGRGAGDGRQRAREAPRAAAANLAGRRGAGFDPVWRIEQKPAFADFLGLSARSSLTSKAERPPTHATSKVASNRAHRRVDLTEKVRYGGRVVSKAVVIAYGVHETGRREILGFDVGEAETEAFWTDFLRALIARGLSGAQLVVSGRTTTRKQHPKATSWRRSRLGRMRRRRRPQGRRPRLSRRDIRGATPTAGSRRGAWDIADRGALRFKVGTVVSGKGDS